ncbi:hypothetical protein [Paenibacillus durus]|uniref:Uncharacterized protein n=1 Tax=Paenibacillus durus ATCC 35681 TaxID=1333534 RepID=A0A0F7FCQ2_PAEDU|nr:hypothetical protein [Paenibacillus durus]AKG36649.1 hypothetical protein VK70_20755 [Paenibacillus durus ATCC 35681]
MREKWDQINREAEDLIEKITSTLRGVDSFGKKAIDDEAFKALFVLLKQVRDFLQDQETVNKRFVALIFYLYGQIHAEAKFTDYPEPIFMLAGQIETYTDELFGRYFD